MEERKRTPASQQATISGNSRAGFKPPTHMHMSISIVCIFVFGEDGLLHINVEECQGST